MKTLRNFFLTGIAVLLPLIVTGYVLLATFHLVDGLLESVVKLLVGRSLPGLGLLLTLGLVLLTGIVATNVIGKKIIFHVERLVDRVPLVKSVYGATKQIIDAFSNQKGISFNRVVLVEYPRKGVYALGFITSEGLEEVCQKTSCQVVNVFVPTTPNPTSGMLLLVPKEEVMFLDMSVEQGLKLIISGGIATQ